ncbi:hypothetical protein ACIOYT_30625 [Streptomyces halstedii]|uniref:hypothetical protein n=1 Tax=Streptomyces halstedii TaxID=1944 RepID=UPI0038178B46
MSVPTPANPTPQGSRLQLHDFGRPSPALLERAIRGYTRFLAVQSPDGDLDGHDQDDDEVGVR